MLSRFLSHSNTGSLSGGGGVSDAQDWGRKEVGWQHLDHGFSLRSIPEQVFPCSIPDHGFSLAVSQSELCCGETLLVCECI